MRTAGRPARVEDVHELALGMPHVRVYAGTQNRPVYQVGGKSFVFFRNPRPDAFDPDTGQRYEDVIVFWVPNEGDKLPWCRTSPRRSSPLRTSTATCRFWSERAGLGRSAMTSSLRSYRRLGFRARQVAEERPGSGSTYRASARTRWRRHDAGVAWPRPHRRRAGALCISRRPVQHGDRAAVADPQLG